MASEVKWETSSMGDAAILHLGPVSIYVNQIGSRRYYVSYQFGHKTIEASSMKTAKAEALRLVREAAVALVAAIPEPPTAAPRQE